MVDSSSVVLLVASVILHSCTATPQYFGGFGRPGFPGNGFSPTSANNINVNVVTGGIHSSGMSPFGGSLFPYLMLPNSMDSFSRPNIEMRSFSHSYAREMGNTRATMARSFYNSPYMLHAKAYQQLMNKKAAKEK
ncbi:hypothetical protein V3C99_016905 [Haemonchus contortus]